jgi:hypothetical protein
VDDPIHNLDRSCALLLEMSRMAVSKEKYKKNHLNFCQVQPGSESSESVRFSSVAEPGGNRAGEVS